ncbi:MAG: type II secretion system protein GspC [Gammaproteobacteria bacterium]|nr:type II secretion system protein GspC [Gammaproteobacteria bacterium]
MKLSVDWKGLPGVVAKGANTAQWVTAVNVTLVVLLAYHTAVLSWRLVPTAEREVLPAVQVASSQQAVVSSGGWNIARWSLLGKESRNTPMLVAQKDIPKTTLKLTLRGVFVADGGGGAIIAEANGKERYYAVNSRISGGVVLSEVHPTRVVLKRNNSLEILELPKSSIKTASSSTRAGNRSSRTGARAAPMSLKQYRKDLLKEPQRLTDAIKMTPKSERGKFIGYQVKPGRDRALFDRVGLMSGDIVTAVNGIQLDTPAKGLNVLRSLQTANSVTLDIKRNGRAQSFDVSID